MRAGGRGPRAGSPIARIALRTVCSAATIALSGVPLAAQSIAQRVASAGDGQVQMTYAARPDACGDGRDLVALGDNITIYPTMEGHGWSNVNCVFGPVRAVVTVNDGKVSGVRAHVGRARAASGRDLGVVSSAEAAGFFLDLLPRLEGRAAKQAVMAAALADSVDIAPRLLAVARDGARDVEARASAMYWMAPNTSAEVVAGVTAIARSGDEPRRVREAALMALSRSGAGGGVTALIALAQRGADDAWVREKATFWLGNAKDERGRAALRTLAERDTVPMDIREQAIFALGHLDADDANGEFLRGLYSRVTSSRLRDKIIMSVSQQKDAASERWLIDLALNDDQPVEMRKKALFWRGQADESPVGELIAMYPRLRERELRDHFTFVLSQRHESAAVDKLIDIARNDPDREIRRKAMFWLGQSDDPRVEKFLREAIER